MARNLKRTGGGGSTISSGGGGSGGTTTTTTTGGGGGWRGSGGSLASGPKGGNYLNGGLGNKYQGQSSSGFPAVGRCCAYQCCSSGYRPGYRRYWYGGYRPTQEGGEAFEGSLQNASLAIQELTLLNETVELYTGDCALVVEESESLLVNRSEASERALASHDNITMRQDLTDLSDRIDAFEWDNETDLSADIRDWFLDYNSLQPCLDELLTRLPTEQDTRVLEVRQEVDDAETIANAWEQRLASSSAGTYYWRGRTSGALAALVTMLGLSLAF